MIIGIVCYPTFGGSGVLATELGIELSKKGYEFFLVSDSGLLSNYSDNDYIEAGAKIVSQNEVFDCDIVCKVNAPRETF